jgi:Tfp pilus assembly protein PilX
MTVRQSQAGMVSFLIVMIMMVIITLIVLGFSQITRRNQRQALDRQLSSQAFYAAESGVNTTATTISSYVQANGFSSLPTKTSCGNDYSPTGAGGVGAPISNLGTAVRYTCVLVNPNPTTLQYNPTQKGSTVIPIQSTGNLKSITFTWNVQSGGNDTICTGANAQVFPTAAAWSCDYGVLHVDLVANPVTNLSNLSGNTVSLLLTPLGVHSGAITLPSFGAASRAYIASASGCDLGKCSVTVTLDGTQSSYYARVTSMYRDAPNMLLSGVLAAGGSATFSGAQAVVDTTGQAQDQLRRIQVRVDLGATADPSTIPTSAIGSSGDICKRFTIFSSDTVDPANLCQ